MSGPRLFVRGVKKRPLRPPPPGPSPKAPPKPNRLKFAALLEQRQADAAAASATSQQPLSGAEPTREQRLPHAGSSLDDEPRTSPSPYASTSFHARAQASPEFENASSSTGEGGDGKAKAAQMSMTRRIITQYPLVGYAIAVGGPWTIWAVWHRWFAPEDDVVLMQGKDTGFLDGLTKHAHATSGGDKRVEL